MANLKIKSESTPERCEICHQSDLFNPTTNFCRRCSDIFIQEKPKNLEQRTEQRIIDITNRITPEITTPMYVNQWKSLCMFVLSGLVVGFAFDRLINFEEFETFWFYADTSASINFPDFLPTWKYYFFAGLFFQFSAWTSYGLSTLKKWISLSINQESLRFWLTVVVTQIGFMALQPLLEVSSNGSLLFLLIPISVGSIITLALKLFTDKLFHHKKVIGILALNLLSYIVFLLLAWIDSKQVSFFYAGLGAFFTMLFGLVIISADTTQRENTNRI